MNTRFRLLAENDVRALLSLDDLIAAMESALQQYTEGTVTQPIRTVLQVGPDECFFALMPAYLSQPPVLGAKLVSVFASNRALGLPSHLATIVLVDPSTGALLAIMDGRYITEARTAAVSAASVRHLARPGAARLGIIGSGVQARSHLLAIAAVRPLSDVRVWSPSLEHREQFVRDMAPRVAVSVRAAGSPEETVALCDVIVLATSAVDPVVRNEWVNDGAHVISVGACRPNQREVDPVLLARARLFVDSREAALKESGDVVIGIAEEYFGAGHIAGELGEVLLGRVAGRASADEVTVFKALGLAVEDVAAAELVYRRAAERGAGLEAEI
jgi:alanine dehydrogenase